jgi:outer membrane protein assembly factor BamC
MRRLRAGSCILSLVAGLALAACSSFSTIDLDKRIDYKSQSGQLPPLEVPPDLTKPGADERYRVPDVNARGTATFSEYNRERAQKSPTTTSSGVLPQVEKARVVRDGSQRYLVVQDTPEHVWQTTKDFWQEVGFLVNIEIPSAGIMETDWAENRARVDSGVIRNFFSRALDFAYSTSERDKFRVRIERGAEPGTTEVFISHRGMEEVYSQAMNSDQAYTRWQPRPTDPLLEAQMLGRLMLRFGVDAPKVQAQMAAAPAAAPRATLVKGENGGQTLSLDDQFDRAWRRVGLALDRVGFTVEDRDRSQGLYYVRYIDPQVDNKSAEKPGLWSRMFGDSKPKLEQFRIQVKDDARNGSNVNVLAKDGQQEKSDSAGRILTLLYDQLK